MLAHPLYYKPFVINHPFWKLALERYIGREDLRYYLIYQLINHSVPLLQCKAVSVLSFIMHLSAVVASMNIIPTIIWEKGHCVSWR